MSRTRRDPDRWSGDSEWSRDGWSPEQWSGDQSSGDQSSGEQWSGEWSDDQRSGDHWADERWPGDQWAGDQWPGDQWAGDQWPGGTDDREDWADRRASRARPPSRLRPAALVLSLIGALAVVTGAAWAVRAASVGAASPGPSRTGEPTATASASPAPARMVFPVVGSASYAGKHHDYPAADIMSACGNEVVAVTDGVIVYVTTVDRYDPKVNDGSTRGGLSVALLGDDGVRYYGSHLSVIDPGIKPGARVAAGQRLGEVGETGNASACHLHFGISPPCDQGPDWWIQRGAIWPQKYLDSWRQGGDLSPVDELAAWFEQNGCPAAP